MKSISVITPCFNEEQNVREVYERVLGVMTQLETYSYEHIFIDNASTDNTVPILKALAKEDKNVKVIINTRNFGHIRSPMHALYQASGDAVVGIVADLQDPPELLPQMVPFWEQGLPMVLAVKKSSAENKFWFWMRRLYYRFINRLAYLETYEDFTGFGLFDKKVVGLIKELDDPYPYFRGMIAEIGLPHAKIYYDQPKRTHGKSKNNLYTLYDLAMLAITNLSKVPLRMATFFGFVSALACVLISMVYLLYKLLFWERFSAGVAPLVLGMFFFASIQLFFLGILGEYVGAIHTLVQRRPYVFERERMNFEYEPGPPKKQGDSDQVHGAPYDEASLDVHGGADT